LYIDARSKEWSAIVCKRAVEWREPVDGELNNQLATIGNVQSDAIFRTSFSWSASLLRFHDDFWLQERRKFHSRSRGSDSVCSRTRTRNVHRFVHERWETAIKRIRLELVQSVS
jgi:hypothetical protein